MKKETLKTMKENRKGKKRGNTLEIAVAATCVFSSEMEIS